MFKIKTRQAVRGEIPYTEIESAYRKAFSLDDNAFLQLLMRIFRIPSPFQFADAYYAEADEELIQMIIDADWGDQEEYEAEGFDCDDFAFALMGVFHQNRETAAMPIFITWVSMPEGGHAVLSYYKDGEVKIIEPQTDQLYSVPSTWDLMLLCG